MSFAAALPYIATGASVLGSFFGGKGKKRSTLDKRQKKLYKDQMSAIYGKGPLANLYQFDPNATTQMFQDVYAKPAYQQFQEEVVPNITGSFRGKNLQNSSYLGQGLSKAGSDVQAGLDRNLAEMLYKGQQDALNRRANAISGLQGMNTQAIDTSGSPLDEFLAQLGGAGSKYILENIFKTPGTTGGMKGPQASMSPSSVPGGGLPLWGARAGMFTG